MNDRMPSRIATTSALTAATNDRLRAGQARIAATWTLVRQAQQRIDRNPWRPRRSSGRNVVSHA